MISNYMLLISSCCLCLAAVNAFVTPGASPTTVSPSSPLLTWELSAKRRGGLGSLIDDDGLGAPTKTKRSGVKQRSTRKSKSANNNKKNKAAKSTGDESAAISPALAQWMDSQSSDDDSSTSAETTAAAPTPAEDSSVSFQTFEEDTPSKKKGNKRRVKQSERIEQDAIRSAQIDQAVDGLMDALEESGNLGGILSAVQSLLTVPSGNLRQLVASSRKLNYRLAWVGSDDAICHVGTGLHKVPLARLQEVFMTCLGKSRLEILEVIRILGPFPNVKNTLQGNTKLNNKYDSISNDQVKGLEIVMDSMVDGTGKEILAGTEENIRRVNLQVYFADERAIVAVVPPEDGSLRENPLQDNGSNVLVFVKEDELDEKLNSLRVL